ncbi:hypothetical protein JTE90_013080 [Oedothorax gibbosus]|uniref:Major facilitator superfamily (MFS) profile domain-containing protein n=1 Tax=Oedothorax gibbosus TaxID=931172 RepID=A0AAV6UJX3_9ARAC|nr:hypothetical protein JTE90_013080 [Oedothorax gibbosus]
MSSWRPLHTKKGMPSAGPDRGWSWVVAGAACFNSLVLAGIFRTSGVLFVAFIAEYSVTREEASWPMVVCISVLNLTGPFSGLLAQRFGVRPVVMCGALVGTAGLAACFFTTSLTLITVFFGGVFGMGYGLVSTLMPVIVNTYFLNLRSTANGIANSGSCFGSVLLPVLFEYLIGHFGLSGCFLLTGGIVLNVAIAGALMKPPEWKEATCRTTKTSEDTTFQRRPSSIEEETCEDRDNMELPNKDLQAELVTMLNRRNEIQRQHSAAMDESPYYSLDTSMSSCYVPKVKVEYDLHRSHKEYEDSISDFQSVVLEIIDTSKSAEGLNRFDPDEVKTSQMTDNCPARHSFSVSTRKRPPSSKFKSPIPSSGPLKRYSLKNANSSEMNSSDLPPVSENGSTEMYGDYENEVFASEEQQHQVLQIGLLNKKAGENNGLGTLQSFARVASSPMFYVTSFTSVSFYFLFHMFVNIIVDYSLDCGVDKEDTKYVLFSFALCDLFGRLSLGWVTDRNFLSRSRFLMVGMAAIGLVFFFLPIATSFWSLVVVSGCYGVLLGSTMIIFPILLLDYLGAEIHAVAYGCLCFMNGFAPFARPYLIGYFRDNLGSYENMFYILGLISVLTSACWVFERCLVPNDLQPLDDKDAEERRVHS